MKNRRFWKTFLAFLFIGLVGIGFLVPAMIPLLEEQLQSLPNVPDLPFEVLVISSLINPLILLIIAIIVGQLTAPKLKLDSYLYHHMQGNRSIWKTFKSNLPIGIILGVIVSAIFFIFELIFQPYLPETLKMSVESRNLVNTLNGIFYGGIVEELLLRWGLMSLLIWMMWKVFQRSKSAPSPAIFWISIIMSSILFALGHLGVNMLAAPLTLLILTRMLLLNGIGGIVFGWLYWKKGLEIAMVSHATLHITTTIITNIWFLL
ncbi:CPBP family intramembrane glutamic endopeptidase [Peribacillus asahii]|uniref:CPBP family intramembrane glutamic endopeptidase n=1 Tax=Peribacillus asahii TaxID=228899 RepID=UPI00380F6399